MYVLEQQNATVALVWGAFLQKSLWGTIVQEIKDIALQVST